MTDKWRDRQPDRWMDGQTDLSGCRVALTTKNHSKAKRSIDYGGCGGDSVTFSD